MCTVEQNNSSKQSIGNAETTSATGIRHSILCAVVHDSVIDSPLFIYIAVVLETESRASHMVGRCSVSLQLWLCSGLHDAAPQIHRVWQ